MIAAANGNVVKVHYTGKLKDGTVFDTSLNRDPVQFQIGAGQLIAGLEEAVIGMKEGESKTTRVPPEKAFGPYHQEQVYVVDRSKFPADVEIGQKFQVGQAENEAKVVTVTDISKGSVTIDGNHALAGRHITLDIQLLEIQQ
jgi:FKBP-type peptidyl-prolyl cis-trans isomerase 2